MCISLHYVNQVALTTSVLDNLKSRCIQIELIYRSTFFSGCVGVCVCLRGTPLEGTTLPQTAFVYDVDEIEIKVKDLV